MSTTSVGNHHESPFRTQNEALLVAAELGDEAQLQLALDRGAQVDAQNERGETALHITARKDDEQTLSTLALLVHRGANLNIAAHSGDKPLYTAASLGHRQAIEFFLSAGANADSWNSKTQRTALYQAVLNNHDDVVKDLLTSGVDVNAQIPTGETPLIRAVINGSTDLVRRLRDEDADLSIQLPNGLKALDFAIEGSEIFKILIRTHLRENGPDSPQIARVLLGCQESDQPTKRFSIKGGDVADKLIACRGFEATIVDFFPDRQAVSEMATVEDLLYGRGVDAIMASAREAGMTRDPPSFRWCHLPANNMEWVSTLMKRMTNERSEGNVLSKTTRFNLGLTDQAGQHLRATTASSSFMRPLCRRVRRGLANEFGSSQKDHLMLFLPYLHHESLDGLNKMGDIMMDTTLRTLQLQSADIDPLRPTYTRMSLKHIELETLNTYRLDYEIDADPGFVLIKRWVPEFEQDFLWNHTRQLRERRAEHRVSPKRSREHSFESARSVVVDGAPPSANKPALHNAKQSLKEKLGRLRANLTLKATNRESKVHELRHQLQREGDGDLPAGDEEDQGPSERARIRTSLSQEHDQAITEIGTNPEFVGRNGSKTEMANNEVLPDDPSKLVTDILNEALIKGYMVPKKYGKFPALQPRRTFDQYFYTHLQDTSRRDRDQVVFRYLDKENQFPRLFMVDQLWLWILNEDTVISCCPQIWNAWSEQVYGRVNNRGKLSLAPDYEDERSIRIMVLKYIESSQGSNIKSVYDLAKVVVEACGNVFDQYHVMQSLQFMDFFERSIGKVTEKEAVCFETFTSTINNPRLQDDVQLNFLFDIRVETALLVEIKDIRDELSILRMVINDQMSATKDFQNSVSQLQETHDSRNLSSSERPTYQLTDVLESHLYRIDKMDSLAAKTYEAINHLLDLKQKQANASEARSARKQAEASRQLAEEAARQADDTAKQGKTLLVFTVITIIFLPLSFMAAFFAINIEGFNLTDSGKLPLSYVIKYMFAISAAVSVPFVLLAFQQERFARGIDWLKGIVMGLVVRFKHRESNYTSSYQSSNSSSRLNFAWDDEFIDLSRADKKPAAPHSRRED